MFLHFFPLENDWCLITGYNNTVRKLRFSGPSQSPMKFPPPQTTLAWHSPSLFFPCFPSFFALPLPLSHQMRLGKGQENPGCDMKCSDCSLDSCVLKEIELTGGYVSIQWAQWPPPPHSYQPSPRLSQAVSPGQLLTAHIWQCGQIHWGHRAIEMYASEDRMLY